MVQKKAKQLRAYIADNWKLGITVFIAVGVLTGLLLYRLGSLTGGVSDSEQALQTLVSQDRIGLSSVVRDSLFLPYDFMQYLLQYTPFTGPTGVRAVGALFGLLGALGMFYIFRTWYTTRIAVLGTALFATSSWFLHTARHADEAAAYLLLPLLIAAMIALQSKARSRLAITAATIFGIATLYLPGVVLFALPALIIKRQVIIAALGLQPLWYRITLGLTAGVMLAPLAWTLIKPLPGQATSLGNALAFLGFPGTQLHSLTDMLTTLKESILGIFAYNNSGALYVPGHLPWFDICTSVLVIIGVWQFIRFWRLDRSKLIAILGALSLVLIALGGSVSAVILLPFLFLFVVEGLKWLLELWLEVFPRNPFARGFAVVMVCILAAAISSYHINKYYLAWARSPETRQVFNNHP